MVNINKTFGENWSLQANVGASISDMRSDASKVRGPIAYGEQTGYDKDGNAIYEPNNIPNVFNVYNLSIRRPSASRSAGASSRSRSSSRPRWASKGAYYLTVTGRNDWPSQLAGPNSVNSSFFYPSVGASVVLGDHPEHAQEPLLRQAACVVRIGGSGFLAFLRQSDPLVELFDQQLEPLVPKSALRPEARTHQIVRSRSYDALPQTFQFRHFVL